MNVELLLKVKAHILEEPRRLLMSHWVKAVYPGLRLETPWEKCKHTTFDTEAIPACKTVGCLAGWATVLSGHYEPSEYFNTDTSCECLGLSFTEFKRLTQVDMWPPSFAQQYMCASTARERAQVTADVIDDFIETDGWASTSPEK